MAGEYQVVSWLLVSTHVLEPACLRKLKHCEEMAVPQNSGVAFLARNLSTALDFGPGVFDAEVVKKLLESMQVSHSLRLSPIEFVSHRKPPAP